VLVLSLLVPAAGMAYIGKCKVQSVAVAALPFQSFSETCLQFRQVEEKRNLEC